MVEIDNFASYSQSSDLPETEFARLRDLSEAPKRGRAQIIELMNPYMSKIKGVKNS